MVHVLFIEDEGGIDVSYRALEHGHQIRVFSRQYDEVKRPIGKGIVPIVRDWRSHVDWADLIFLESNNTYMHEMDGLRERGKLVIGGNEISADWELDRAKGMEVFRRAGVDIPEYRDFTHYDEAIDYVKKEDRPFVSKPSGKCDDKSLSYVAKAPDDLIYRLSSWKAKHGNRAPFPFILQEKIDGIEFAVGAWFGPGGFAEGWEENFEHKKLITGDLGPNCGEMGTILRYVKFSKLANKVLKPLEAQLERIGYVGNVDVNCIIDEKGNPWPLEFTMRFGWPTFTIQMVLFEWDPIEFLCEFARGRDTSGAYRLDDVACGVIPVIPPFPSNPKDFTDVIGLPIFEMADDFSFEEVQAWRGDKSGVDAEFATAGMVIGVACAKGDTVRHASRKAYKELDQLRMVGSPWWRNDIGDGLRETLPKLQEHGYALKMEY